MKMSKKLLLCCAVILCTAFSQSALAQQNNGLTGAGSTLAYPLLSKVFDNYSRASKQIVNYQANGSGTGMVLLNQKNIDFAITDLSFTKDRIKKFSAPVICIPLTTSIVAIVYNVPGIKAQLNLNADVLTGIYTGKINNWNDARIAKLNTGIKLPNLKILVAHRSDESGSTEIFSQYFKGNTDWEKPMGGIIPAKWPVGTGIKTTQGIAGLVKLTPGTIGYVGLPYAIEYKIPIAALQIKNGTYVLPTSTGYPLVGNTGIIVYQNQEYSGRSLDKAKQLTKLLRYTINQAQKLSRSLKYRTLLAADIGKANSAIHSIIYNGKKI